MNESNNSRKEYILLESEYYLSCLLQSYMSSHKPSYSCLRHYDSWAYAENCLAGNDRVLVIASSELGDGTFTDNLLNLSKERPLILLSEDENLRCVDCSSFPYLINILFKPVTRKDLYLSIEKYENIISNNSN